MKSKRSHKEGLVERFGYLPVLLAFLLLFSLGMGSAIYFKLNGVAKEITPHSVIFWQIVIWMPLAFVLPLLQYVILKSKFLSERKVWLRLGFFGLLLIGLHFAWFYIVSSSISPYSGLPKTKYGVYPFFFIFWITIDAIFLAGLMVYLKLISKDIVKSAAARPPHSLYVKKGNKAYLLKPHEILWIAAEDYYVKLHTAQGNFLERKSLKAILSLLPADQFIRIHRSTVVNISAITELHTISGQKAEVRLKGGHIRNVSRTYLKALKDILTRSQF
jgi:hypothetical protein